MSDEGNTRLRPPVTDNKYVTGPDHSTGYSRSWDDTDDGRDIADEMTMNPSALINVDDDDLLLFAVCRPVVAAVVEPWSRSNG